MRPGARKRDIEVVASRIRLETAFPGRTGASVQSDPVSESAFLTDKAASGDASIVPAIGPFPVNKKAHARTLLKSLILDHSNHMGRERRRTGFQTVRVLAGTSQDGMSNMDFQSDAAQPQLKVPFDVDLEETWQ
jgi:hypothetical protein